MHNLERLHIIHYPDPRLRAKAAPVERFDGELAALSRRMLELMHEAKGVGLAAPQLGVPLRLFVMNPTGEPADDRVVVNPCIDEPEGAAEGEEGCLSIPSVRVQVRRAMRCRLRAHDESGAPIELALSDLPARICQHETDHLDGVLILDRMGPTDRIATRRTLKALEDSFRGARRTAP